MSTELVDVEDIVNLCPLIYGYNENDEPESLTSTHFINYGKEFSFPANFFDVIKDDSNNHPFLKEKKNSSRIY